MNPKTAFHLFSPEGKAHLPVAPLVIGLAVLSLLALTACGALPASAPGVEGSSPGVALAAVTENEGGQPVTDDIEAVRAQNYTAFREKNAAGAALAAAGVSAGSAYLAENPELLKARPPVWSLSVICARNLAANPELLKARPPALAEEMTGSAFLGANPELLKVRPPVWSLSDICARSLAANPTLLEARPPALAEEMTGSAYLAENPELMVARRYEALAK